MQEDTELIDHELLAIMRRLEKEIYARQVFNFAFKMMKVV